MKILIAYSSYGGVTKECADILISYLNDRCKVELIDVRQNSIPSPENYDAVILGSSIRMGSMNKKLKKYVKLYKKELSEMPCGVFFCCGFTRLFQEYVDTQLPKGLEPSLGCHMFGGELKPEKLKGIDKLAVMLMRNSIKSQDFEENDSDHHDLPEIFPENIILLAKEIRKISNNC